MNDNSLVERVDRLERALALIALQGGSISTATGGSVIDVQARVALVSILKAIREIALTI